MEWDCDDNNLESIQEHYANCGYDEDTETVVDNDAESNNVTSFLPVRALFKVNLWPKETEEIVICLAEESVKNRRQIVQKTPNQLITVIF